MRLLLLGMSALALLAAATLPARACINDREVKRSEREFKSQYQRPAGEPSFRPAPPQDQVVSAAFLGGGSVLLLGAVGLVVSQRKSPGAG